MLYLSDVLRVFSLPIKEEQAWAVCYCTAKILTDLIEKGGKVSQLCEQNIGFEDNGDVRIQTATSLRETGHDLSEAELIEYLGVVIVKALNYGLHPDHPLSISENLDSLLLHMTSTLSHDEGVAACSVLSFEDVITACAGRISSDSDKCDAHYKSVCQAMVAEASELTSFLDVIGNSNGNEENNLQRGDWARIWLSVMSELRHGVKLKHLKPSDRVRHPAEYELTPFEVLLTDIRSQRYRLNQVMVNGEIPQSVRKSAESLILDYIRSRPPLKAAPVNTGKKPSRPPTAREMLLTAIRNSEFHLRPTPPKSLSSSTSPRISSSSTPSGPTPHRRKVIKIDRSRISADSDPEDECSTNSSTSTTQPEKEAMAEAAPVSSTIVNPQIKKLRTVAMTRSRSLSPPPDVGSRADRLNKQQTMGDSVASPVESEPDIQMDNLSPPSQKCPLTFDELARIRSVLTAAELEQLAVCPHVQSDVAAGRVCFACRKIRFNLTHWATRCRLCGWSVCKKCILPAVSLPGFERGVPVCCDCHELLEMVYNPKSPASSLSPSESATIQNHTNDDPTETRRIVNDQKCA